MIETNIKNYSIPPTLTIEDNLDFINEQHNSSEIFTPIIKLRSRYRVIVSDMSSIATTITISKNRYYVDHVESKK